MAAALLVTPTYLAKFDMGESLGNKAFFAAIIGGFNNSRGALLGGVIVGRVPRTWPRPTSRRPTRTRWRWSSSCWSSCSSRKGLLGKKVERKV